MSTNENPPLPDGDPSTSPVPAPRSALAAPLDAGWSNLSEYDLAPESPSNRTSPVAYLHGLRRHWILATSLGIVFAVVAALGVWLGWGPRYTASAYFQIATVPPSMLDSSETRITTYVQSAFEIYKDTQAQLIRSTNVLTDALRDPDINELEIVKREEDEIRWLQDNLRVSFPGEAELMEISLTDNDGKKGEEVAKVVAAVVDAYQRGVVEAEQNRRDNRLDELEKVYEEKRDEVLLKSQNLRDFAKHEGTSDPETLRLKEQMAMRQFADIQSQHSQSVVLLERARGDLAAQRALLSHVDIVPIPELDVENYVRNHPMVRQLSDSLAGQMMALAETERNVSPYASPRFTQQHSSDVGTLENRIAALGTDARTKIREKMRSEIEEKIRELEVQVEVALEQEQRLAQSVINYQEEVGKLGTSSVDLKMQLAEVDRSNEVLMSIRQETQRMKVESNSEPRIRLLQAPKQPSSEDRLGVRVAMTVLASIVGLCIPVGTITWWDTRAQKINSAEDVSKRLGLTVLGLIPKIPIRALRQLDSSSHGRHAWHLRLTEAVDGVAARLLRQAEVAQTRVILISSANGGEGKTTLATQLAMSLARNGRHTALVDFDLRQPAFDKVLGVPLSPGVSEVLRGQCDATEVIHVTGTENLEVMTAGRWDRTALKALANGAAGKLLGELRAKYDFVIVDSAPVLPVADTRFISQHVDTVILSVFRDISRSPKITATVEILEAFGVAQVETVVTGPTETLPVRDLVDSLQHEV